MSSSDLNQRIRISHLRCEYLVAPLGIDELRAAPELGH